MLLNSSITCPPMVSTYEVSQGFLCPQFFFFFFEPSEFAVGFNKVCRFSYSIKGKASIALYLIHNINVHHQLLKVEMIEDLQLLFPNRDGEMCRTIDDTHSQTQHKVWGTLTHLTLISKGILFNSYYLIVAGACF